MELRPEYEIFVSHGVRMPSVLVAVLPSGTEPPDSCALRERVEDCQLPGVQLCEADDSCDLRVTLSSGREEGERSLSASVRPLGPDEHGLLAAADLSPEVEERLEGSEWGVCTVCEFGDSPLSDFHDQLRLVAALAPDAVVVLDIPACTCHLTQWVLEAAASRVPPPPSRLFSIHAVSPDEGHKGGVWVHSHGLIRCGCIELEMLDVPADELYALGELFNVVAALFIDKGVPAPGAAFSPGHGISMCWLPWEEGLRKAPRGIGGGHEDRDVPHSLPSAVLFARGRWPWRRYQPVRSLAGRLSGDPLLYVSDMETERMSLLAAELFHRFGALHARFGDRDDWVFLTKIGYPIDNAGSENEREHLWFRVHAVNGDSVDATLTNAPYAISRMREGQRGKHSLLRMSDWAIMCPHGHFRPDTVGALERLAELES